MREERRTPLHELPALVPRQGMHVVSSLVLVLILVLLVHVGNQVGHSLHELGLHGHQLFHGKGGGGGGGLALQVLLVLLVLLPF